MRLNLPNIWVVITNITNYARFLKFFGLGDRCFDPVPVRKAPPETCKNNRGSARLNTETPAWAIDRLSILALKIYHMAREAERTDVGDAHRAACRKKLDVLLAQQVDLSGAIEELIGDIEAGRKYMKTYKQMKMYNDPALNPVLYGQKK